MSQRHSGPISRLWEVSGSLVGRHVSLGTAPTRLWLGATDVPGAVHVTLALGTGDRMDLCCFHGRIELALVERWCGVWRTWLRLGKKNQMWIWNTDLWIVDSEALKALDFWIRCNLKKTVTHLIADILVANISIPKMMFLSKHSSCSSSSKI